MTFNIKRVITKHVLTHNKDFALVELAYEGEPASKYFKPEENRYGTIEYGQGSVCLADCASSATISGALARRETFEDMTELIERFGGPDESLKNPQFKAELDKLMARA